MFSANTTQISSGGVGQTLWIAQQNNSNGEQALNTDSGVRPQTPIPYAVYGVASTYKNCPSGTLNSGFLIKQDGSLWAAGDNATIGLLGIGNKTDQEALIFVHAGPWSVCASAGHTASAAIKTDGTLWTWGDGASGCLGLNSTTDYSVPMQVGALTNWSKVVVANGNYMLAVKTNGTLWAWGSNGTGQLGDGTTIDRSSPVQIGSDTDWASVGCTGDASFAIKTNGTLWAWGVNTNGQLGLNLPTLASSRKSSPTQVGANTNWAEVNGSDNTVYARTTTGALFAWGSNAYGQVGDITVVNRSSPVQIVSSGVAFAAAQYVTAGMYVDTSGNLWTWGRNAAGAQTLFDATTVSRSSPVQVGNGNYLPMQPVVCSLDNTKAGSGYWWYLPKTNSTADYVCPPWPFSVGKFVAYTPSPGNLSPVWATGKITTGVLFGAAIKTDGTLWTWGDNASGALGIDSVIDKSSPTQVGALTDWSSVSAGYRFMVATKTDGTLWSWGVNAAGQLGQGTGGTANRSSPVQVGALTNWSQVSASNIDNDSYASVLAVKTDGTLWGWGSNDSGQLGLGTIVNKNSPNQVGALTNWKQVSTNGSYVTGSRGFTLAVKTDGTLWSWGYGVAGVLASGATTSRSSPVQVGALTNWSKVYAGPRNGLAIKTDGTLWAWGDGTYGKLGTNAGTADASSPVQVGALTDWVDIASTYYTSFGLRADGTIWVWGQIESYAGQGSLANALRSSPVQIGNGASPATGWTSIAACSHTTVQNFLMATKT